MRRHFVALCVAGLFAACGFPHVDYETIGDDGGTEASADAPSGGDAAGEEGASSSGGDAAQDGLPSDANSYDDVVDDYVFEASPDAPACDHDQDHDLAPGGTCGGTDCDDDDPRAYFGEPDYLTFAPTPVTKGDWDCNGVLETEFPTGFSCGLLQSNCTSAAGFTDTPGCGQSSSSFITCKNGLGTLVCAQDTKGTRIEGCK